MSRISEMVGGIVLTCFNLAILLTLVLVVIPRLDRHAAEEAEQTRQLKANLQTSEAIRGVLARQQELSAKTLEATRENHRLHEQHQIDLKVLSEKMRALSQRPGP